MFSPVNLDKIALDLYGKIQTRFTDIKMGDENAAVLSKKADIPRARFFEFEYTEDGRIFQLLDEFSGYQSKQTNSASNY